MHTFKPLVSVIIPTYNHAPLISETLHSVQNQTYENWECIVVDDFSTDPTKQIIDLKSQEDPRFIYLVNKRSKGAPGARNTGLCAAKGEYIIFFDSDDLMMPECIERRIKYFKSEPNLDFVIALQKRKENERQTFYVNVPSQVPPLIRFYSLFPNNDIPWINNSLIIKKAFLLKNEILWDETVEIHQDIQFNVSLLVSNPNYKWSKDDFDCYWVFKDGIENIGRKHHNSVDRFKKLIEIYLSNLNNKSIDFKLKSQLKMQYHASILAISFDLASQKATGYNLFLEFLQRKTEFSWFEFMLLSKYGKLQKRTKRLYIHRLLSRKIKEYLNSEYPPVILVGTFLKVRELRDMAETKYDNF